MSSHSWASASAGEGGAERGVIGEGQQAGGHEGGATHRGRDEGYDRGRIANEDRYVVAQNNSIGRYGRIPSEI